MGGGASKKQDKKEEPKEQLKEEEPKEQLKEGKNASKFQETKVWTDLKAYVEEQLKEKSWLYWNSHLDEVVKEVTPKLETFNKSEALDALKKEAHRELEAVVPDKVRKDEMFHIAKLAFVHAVEEANVWPQSEDPYWSIFLDKDVGAIKRMFEKAIALGEEKKYQEAAEFLVQSVQEMHRLTELRFTDAAQIEDQKKRREVERDEVLRVVAASLENRPDDWKKHAERVWTFPAPLFGFRAVATEEIEWRCVRVAGGDWHIQPTI